MPTARRKPVLAKIDQDVLRRTNTAKSSVFLDPDIFRVAVFDIETTGLKGDFDIILVAVVRPYGTREKAKSFHIDLHTPDLLKAEKILLKEIVEELDTYDGLITYYGSMFDVPMLRTRMFYHGLSPFPKIKHLDMYFTVRRTVNTTRKRMDTINELLRISTSPKTPEKTRIAMRDWMGAVFSRDKRALGYIVDHCLKDCEILENIVHEFTDFVPDRILRR